MHALDVGSIQVFTDVKLQVVAEGNRPCFGCYFSHEDGLCHIGHLRSILGACCELNRHDHTDVIFKKIP